jgi:hypothetical protein
MHPLYRAVYALGVSIVGLAAVVLSISEASSTTSHEFLDHVQPAMDAAVPAAMWLVLVIAGIGMIAMVGWMISTARPSGGGR